MCYKMVNNTSHLRYSIEIEIFEHQEVLCCAVLCCLLNLTFSICSRCPSGAAVVGYVTLLSWRYFTFHTCHLEVVGGEEIVGVG